MKKSVKLKKFGLTTVTLFVCLAVMLTCFAFTFPSFSAFAAETPTPLVSGVKVVDKCDYGDSFTVSKPDSGVKVAVTSPDGKIKECADSDFDANNVYTVKATQTGSYTVTYFKGDTLAEATAKYDFRVYVSLDEEYFLRVDDKGADIPTYIKTGGKIKLPDAGVYYYDENKILREYTGANITITSGDTKTPYSVGDEINCSTNGKMFFTYTAQLGEGGSKHMSQTFTVNVQDTFEDVSRPTLTVAGVSSNISVKRPVTLPKATATDDFDQNIKIKITVKGPDSQPVRVVDVDEDGYGYQKPVEGDYTQEDFDRDYPVAVFDNDEAMVFYPMTEGDYTVEYVAEDDSEKESARRTFTMRASDRVAPVFKEIAEDAIPEKWGMSVYSDSEKTNKLDNSGKITFTVPTIVDNKSHVWTEGDESDDLIDLLFRITDADNNRTVVEFSDILADRSDDSKKSGWSKKGNSTYADGEDIEFDLTNGFTFDFSKYDRKDSNGNTAESKAGSYTVYFRAGDKAGNHSSKSYTITLENEYVDSVAPVIEDLDVQPYISTGESFTVPAPVATDANDSRLTIEYSLVSGDKSVTVKGGEKAEFKTVDTATYLVLDEDEEEKNWLEIAADKNLYFVIKATDDVGNVTYNTKDNSATAAQSKTVMNIIDGAIKTGAEQSALKVDGIVFTGEKKVGKIMEAGSFTVETTNAMRKYTGFEVGVYNENGNAVNVELTTYTTVDKDNDKAVIHVKNIKIEPTTAGKHTMVVRAFNVNGYSAVNVYSFDVAESGNNQGGTGSASTIGTSGSINTTYKLHNESIENIGEAGKTYCVVRKINSSSVYALMGSEITFKTQGSARIQDGYSQVTDGDIGTFVPYGADDGKYTVSVTDTDVPVIEAQGVAPTYSEKNVEVVMPSVIGYNKNGPAEIKVSVSASKGSNPKATLNDNNQYVFTPTEDGTYTVTYTAVAGNGKDATASYTITVGDVKGPEFSRIDGTKPSDKIRVGSTFKFDKVAVIDEDNTTDFRVTKKLYDPTGAVVSSATVTGSYNSYKDVQQPDDDTDIKLTMSGDYIVEYIVSDKAGNETTQRVKISVVSKGSGKAKTFTGLSIALTVIAVVLLAGVIIYVVRFRKVKSK